MLIKKLLLYIIIFSFFLVPAWTQNVSIKTYSDTLSYSIGYNIGKNLKNSILRDTLKVTNAMVLNGLNDALSKDKALLADTIIQKTMMALQQELMAKQEVAKKEEEKKMKELGDKSKVVGAEFLEKNKKMDGVKTTASGLQYKVIKEGNGKMPKDTSKVKVHYKGTFLDGKVFDSSIDRGQPIEFPLNGVIKGWTEGVQLMKEGSKYIFYIPSDLAYGDRGAPPTIPPYSVLIFEVELLEVK